LIIKKNKTSF